MWFGFPNISYGKYFSSTSIHLFSGQAPLTGENIFAFKAHPHLPQWIIGIVFLNSHSLQIDILSLANSDCA
jgi:hypothetical protein